MKGKSILITGGTGSFGKAFIRNILSNHPDVNKLIVFSRDELKQYEMQNEFNAHKYPQIRFYLGDIRDKERLKRAFQGIDIIVVGRSITRSSNVLEETIRYKAIGWNSYLMKINM